MGQASRVGWGFLGALSIRPQPVYLFLEGLPWLGVCKSWAIRNTVPPVQVPCLPTFQQKSTRKSGQEEEKPTWTGQDHQADHNGPAGPWTCLESWAHNKRKYTEQGLFPECQSYCSHYVTLSELLPISWASVSISASVWGRYK